MPSSKAITEFLDRTVYENTVLEWVIAAAIAFVIFVVFRLVKAIFVYRTRRLAKHFQSDWGDSMADILASTRIWFLFVVAVYVSSLTLDLSPKTTRILHAVTIVTVLIQLAIWGNALLTLTITRYVRQRMETDAASVTMIAALGFLGRLVLWTVVALLAMENLGVDVTALVAGLGVGGIAVVLAAQSILGDLFASLSIVLDKPFVLGDSISVGTDTGSVEKIGLRTTHVRSTSGEQLILSNTDLVKSRIRNYKRMLERRILFSVGVTYQTSEENLAAISGILREIVEAQPQVRFDRAHLKEFGASSINFEVVYFVLSPQYNAYMDTQQEINLQLFKRFRAGGIEFAFPTQTLFVYDSTPKPSNEQTSDKE